VDLVLWRHCEAAPGVPDEARRLTPLGLAQAARVASWLNARLPADARIVVSPAVRAQQTAQALGREFATSAGVGTGTSVEALLESVQWPDARGVVLVVGHQPTLGRVAAWLVDNERDERVIGTGGVVWLTNDDVPGRPARVKRLAESPEA
jgi:phosphohistidine phosphatase